MNKTQKTDDCFDSFYRCYFGVANLTVDGNDDDDNNDDDSSEIITDNDADFQEEED